MAVLPPQSKAQMMDKCDLESVDFDSLLEDLLDDDETLSSGEDTCVASPSSFNTTCSDSSCGSKRRKHRNNYQVKRLISVDVRAEDGSLVEFQAFFPKPRVVKSDIRRSYPAMYTNVMNSDDFPLIFGFLDTFCVPSFSHRMSTTFDASSPNPQSVSYQRIGLVDCAKHWYHMLQCFPDATMSLSEAAIAHSDNEKDSRVLGKYTFNATNVYQMAWKPQPLQEVERTRTRKLKCDLESMSAVGMKRGLTQAEKAETMVDIVETVDAVKNDLRLLETPEAVCAQGSFVMHLDRLNRITMIELTTYSQ